MERVLDYDFELPEERIAQSPEPERDQSRLFIPTSEQPHRQFCEISDLLPEGALLVVNDTQVVAARLRAHKESGGSVELFVVSPTADPQTWLCLGRSSKPLRVGAVLTIDASPHTATVSAARDTHGLLSVSFSGDVQGILEECGELPLPPYIDRPDGPTAEDRERYQTVYARVPGAVAAPTAGLHFTPAVTEAITARGVEIVPVTLHVGLGTFAPLRVTSLADVVLHRERYHIPGSTAAAIATGRPVVAVGTTVVRTLEAAAIAPGRVCAGDGETEIFIRPGFDFQVVSHLVTNFHLPQSSLLMLVCAFAGYQRVMAAYRVAVEERYRFYSYGDAMLLSRHGCDRRI